MKTQRGPIARLLVTAILCGAFLGSPLAENIDPSDDDSQYTYAENVGWMNAEPSGNGGPGIQVGDSELSGWIWGENVGWLSLSCKNTLSCVLNRPPGEGVDYGVSNDGNGVLSDYAWAENTGWINFSPSTSGVTIDPATGEFSGYAWGENVGWISFNCANTASCATADYKVKTGWVCDPLPAAPTGVPTLTATKLNGSLLVSWTAVPGATQYDVVRVNLNDVTNTGGDFTVSACIDDNRTTTNWSWPLGSPASDTCYLVRATNCGGSGSYDSGGGGQVGSRDAEITTCP